MMNLNKDFSLNFFSLSTVFRFCFWNMILAKKTEMKMFVLRHLFHDLHSINLRSLLGTETNNICPQPPDSAAKYYHNELCESWLQSLLSINNFFPNLELISGFISHVAQLRFFFLLQFLSYHLVPRPGIKLMVKLYLLEGPFKGTLTD